MCKIAYILLTKDKEACDYAALNAWSELCRAQFWVNLSLYGSSIIEEKIQSK